MSAPLNQYGDQFSPTEDGRGVDIASQRQDELDQASLRWIVAQAAARKIQALDLGGGFGAQSVRMAKAGASIVMIDIADMASGSFRAASEAGLVQPEQLRFVQKDFTALTAEDIPDGYDVLYSQRAIHYIPYQDAQRLLTLLFNRMRHGGVAYISAAGFDTEYGKTYPDRDKPIAQRFNFVAADMQQKHGITHRIVTYKEEELADLLKDAGFSDIAVTNSTFGNIKATARKS